MEQDTMTNLYGRVYDPQRGVWGVPFMIDSGTFWRCRHNRTQFNPCWRCGIWHPAKWFRHVLAGLRG